MLTAIQCPFHSRVTTEHVKDPSHSAKSVGGRLHLNMHTPSTYQSQSGLTIRETSSHTTHQEMFSHSHLSMLSCCGQSRLKGWNWCAWTDLHFKTTKRKKEMHGWGWIHLKIVPQNLCMPGKCHQHQHLVWDQSVHVFHLSILVIKSVTHVYSPETVFC